MQPGSYNLSAVCQTEDYFMIMNEMIHNVRIVKMNSNHRPGPQCIGRETPLDTGRGTLVIETKNFGKRDGFRGLHS
ncbi:MAG: hypothetical protein Ct9H90mP25_1150 [Gammaproteobacteria bacterium]|nr:MAG: hypothetical protein Ct9H90mP25_1150 [Gammaproteobacteria bacterium]